MMRRNFDSLRYLEDGDFKGVFIPLDTDTGDGEGGLILIIPFDGGNGGLGRWSSLPEEQKEGFLTKLLKA